ncbi:hypothetical protein RFI_34755, partial [Reticulomyxa filosa]
VNKKMELLAFGLMIFSPCIQLNCNDDNITLDDLNELIKYCDKQAIEWKFPTHQSKWIDDNTYNDIPYLCLNNEIEEVSDDKNTYKGCYAIVHEAARSGDLSQFKLVLQNHPKIDINNSCNEHRQTPLHLAINHQHWDYIIVEEFKHKCSDLMDDWSCNVVHRLINLGPCNEMNHCIYLSLYKTLDYVLARVDNRWMNTVPLNTPHPSNGHELIQPYLAAHFKSNDSNIDKNKGWLKEYIKKATTLKDGDSSESMKHLYCGDNKALPPREGNNCYLRSHNVGYQIRLGDVIYGWFIDQEGSSFAFKKKNYNKAINEEKSDNENIKGGNKSNECLSSIEIPSHSELMKILSNQLKVKYDD